LSFEDDNIQVRRRAIMHEEVRRWRK